MKTWNLQKCEKPEISLTLLPRHPIIPLLTLSTLRWPICFAKSFRTHTDRNRPTIFLLATRQYFNWLKEADNPTTESKSLALDWRVGTGELLGSDKFLGLRLCDVGDSRGQLQALRRVLSALKFLLSTLREGFWKK